MKATYIVIFASIIAVTGRWARHKQVDTSMVVGGIVLAVMITALSDADEDLAEKFAWLILFAIMGTNAEDLLKAIGLITDKRLSSAAVTAPGGN